MSTRYEVKLEKQNEQLREALEHYQLLVDMFSDTVSNEKCKLIFRIDEKIYIQGEEITCEHSNRKNCFFPSWGDFYLRIKYLIRKFISDGAYENLVKEIYKMEDEEKTSFGEKKVEYEFGIYKSVTTLKWAKLTE